MTPPDLPPLREVIRKHDLKARKSLGQHFLLDSNLTGRIVRAAGDLKGYHVIEVGPGPGGLTRALLESPALTVTVLEKDHRCLSIMAELKNAFGNRLKVVAGDALKTDIPALTSPPRKIVANLPYNLGTPLLLRWLREIEAYRGLTLMFQSEVADRLIAQPRTKAYGRLSVITQWLCEVNSAFNIPKEAFTPPPNVTSTVSNLTPRPSPLCSVSFEALETVTAIAFGKRRKMLRASLKTLNLDLSALEIEPTRRPEELSVIDFCRLANALVESRAWPAKSSLKGEFYA